jgi:integral membrane protein
MANVTGVMLLLLTLEIIIKYGFLGGHWQAGDVVAIVHGWVYVVYLVTVFDLWSKLRWPFGRFVVLVLAGVVPLLSFFAERRVVAEVRSGRSGPAVSATPRAREEGAR